MKSQNSSTFAVHVLFIRAQLEIGSDALRAQIPSQFEGTKWRTDGGTRDVTARRSALKVRSSSVIYLIFSRDPR